MGLAKLSEKRKKQQLKPTKENINQLLKMIKSTLKAIAIVKNLSIFSNVTNTAVR